MRKLIQPVPWWEESSFLPQLRGYTDQTSDRGGSCLQTPDSGTSGYTHGMAWHGPGSRVLLLENQGLDSGLKVKPKQSGNLPPDLPAPAAQSSASGGHRPGLGTREKTGWVGKNFLSPAPLPPLDFIQNNHPLWILRKGNFRKKWEINSAFPSTCWVPLGTAPFSHHTTPRVQRSEAPQKPLRSPSQNHLQSPLRGTQDYLALTWPRWTNALEEARTGLKRDQLSYTHP